MEQILHVVVMNPIPADHGAVRVGKVKEIHGAALPRTGAVMMNITVLHSDIPAGAGLQCPVTAFIDVGSRHGQTVAVSRLDADGAAAVEAAFIDGNVAAEVKRQNAAGTETGLGGVAGRKLFQRDTPAGGEL